MNSDHLSSPTYLEQKRKLQRAKELREQGRLEEYYETLIDVQSGIFAIQNTTIVRLQQAVLQRDATLTEVTAELKALREKRVATITKLTAELRVQREIVATSCTGGQDFSEMICRYEAATRTNDAATRRLNYENRKLRAERDEVAQERAMEIIKLKHDHDALNWTLEAQERRLLSRCSGTSAASVGNL
ncbi:hypothetical protein KCU65_g6199, partial [Aureobasidium melanogenum]